jgi:thiamine kinase-like enzyme
MIRLLHTSNKKTNYYFDIWKEIKKFEHNIAEVGRNDFMDLAEMHETIKRIHKLVDSDNVPKCLCHCDCYDPNFLIDRKDKMYLIDWEYSGMADPACDIGTFLACSDYNMQEADNIIKCYLQHKPEIYELRHYIGYTAVLSYYWFVWAIYQDSVGKNVGKYLYVWYQYTKSYSKRALELYCSGGQE